jgi:hypothetical protein
MENNFNLNSTPTTQSIPTGSEIYKFAVDNKKSITGVLLLCIIVYLIIKYKNNIQNYTNKLLPKFMNSAKTTSSLVNKEKFISNESDNNNSEQNETFSNEDKQNSSIYRKNN